MIIYIVLNEFKNTLFYAELHKRPNNSNNKKYAVYRISQAFRLDYFKLRHVHHKKVTMIFRLSIIKELAYKYGCMQNVEFDRYEEAINYITADNNTSIIRNSTRDISIIRYDTDRKKVLL